MSRDFVEMERVYLFGQFYFLLPQVLVAHIGMCNEGHCLIHAKDILHHLSAKSYLGRHII